ncbi:Flp pilus assembly complex ATPase component TadA, partial [Bacillus sp. S34]|nr:Flp pilus assembly complex ATPase component TadA [Bacillus sp. S34]
VETRRNVLVTGATGSGKTTMLAAMLGAVPHDERIVTIEDVAEFGLSCPIHEESRALGDSGRYRSQA